MTATGKGVQYSGIPRVSSHNAAAVRSSEMSTTSAGRFHLSKRSRAVRAIRAGDSHVHHGLRMSATIMPPVERAAPNFSLILASGNIVSPAKRLTLAYRSARAVHVRLDRNERRLYGPRVARAYRVGIVEPIPCRRRSGATTWVIRRWPPRYHPCVGGCEPVVVRRRRRAAFSPSLPSPGRFLPRGAPGSCSPRPPPPRSPPPPSRTSPDPSPSRPAASTSSCA